MSGERQPEDHGTQPSGGGPVAALEQRARALLPRAVYDYYAGGAEDEVTLRANRDAFARYALRPRVLRDVSRVDTSVRVLDTRFSLPVLLAPTAFQRLAHAEGELATVRAAAAIGTSLVASTLSTHTVEDTCAAWNAARQEHPDAPPPWFQLYVFRQRSITEELVRRAEAAGCAALVLTATVPVQGNRERDAHNRFSLPPDLEMANFTGMRQAVFPEAAGGSRLMAFISSEFDPALTWDAIAWLRSITTLPLLVKGVMTYDDARLAVEHGVDGVVVSNHGGRQLDGALASLRALPDVCDGVAGRIPVLMDGGVRRGSDVVKALLLGAQAVMIGRAYLWGLAAEGGAGVERVLDSLRGEVARTLALLGATSPAELSPTALVDLTR